PGVDARAEDRDLRFFRQRVDLPRLPDVRVARIREFFGRRHDRGLRFENRVDLRQHLPDRRTRAQHDDVRLRLFQRAPGLARYLHAHPLRQPDDVAEIAPDFGGIDIDGADDRESRTRRDLLRDGRADRPESEVHHAYVGHSVRIILTAMTPD